MMKLAALCSGGKDGAYALWLAKKMNHEISDILVMVPENENSWMFHRPNPSILELFQEAYGIPVQKVKTTGEKKRELDDLKSALLDFDVEGIVAGAVASTYQRKRIEKICEDLDLSPVFPLWQRDPERMLENIIEEGFEVVITSVAAEGLNQEWIGRKIDRNCLKDLKELNEKFGIHTMGEGGEYETLVLDAPFFKKRIVLREYDVVWKGDRGRMEIEGSELMEKDI